jgi:preprotein translocase subunit SecY
MAVKSNTRFGMFEPVILFLSKYLTTGGFLYIGLEVLLIFFFTFFYASIMPNMQPREIADNLKKYGSSIPGIKPGRPTAEFLETILMRIIFIGAVFMAVLALVPNSVESILGQASGVMVFRGIGATSLIIMVGVALDFVNQIKVHLLSRQYEGFLKP